MVLNRLIGIRKGMDLVVRIEAQMKLIEQCAELQVFSK